MRKLLQINTVVNFASTGKIAEALGKKAIENEWLSFIAHGRHQKFSYSKTVHIGNRLDFYWHALATRIFDLHGLMSRSATKKLISEIESIQPDLIHLHNLHGYFINFPLLFDFLATYNKPVVWTLHDCWSLTGHCTHFEQVGCFKWKEECHNCPQLKEYPRTLFFDRTRKNHRLKKKYFNKPNQLHVVTVSNWLKQQVMMSILKNVPTSVIYNGIDTSIFRIEPNKTFKNTHNPEHKKIILGVAGNWTANKGLDDFIKLRAILEEDYLIVLIGLNTKQLKRLPKGIIGISRTESVKELVNWYNLADVYFNASVEETFGMTSLEALACGTPIVVYNATACPEIVTEKVGRVAQKQNINDVRNHIKNIIEIGKATFSETCSKYAHENFSSSNQFDAYFKLYDALLNKNDTVEQ